jgi:hypothetical protein
VSLPPVFMQTVDAGTPHPRATCAPEGAVLARAMPPEPTVTNDSRGYDQDLQQRANVIAKELLARKGRWPTKAEVIKVLASKVGKTRANVMRRISNEWNPRRHRSQERIEVLKRKGRSRQCLSDDAPISTQLIET